MTAPSSELSRGPYQHPQLALLTYCPIVDDILFTLCSVLKEIAHSLMAGSILHCSAPSPSLAMQWVFHPKAGPKARA